jgi:CheY-like chemotaxis protein
MLDQTPTNTPCIFVLESDDNVRPTLKHNLQHWGYDVVIAIDEEDALQRIQAGQTQFDLILLNQSNQSIDAMMAIGQQIRQSTERNSFIPIVIMAEDYGADLEGQNTQIGDNEYVTYLEDGEQLKDILQTLCPV